MKHGVDPDIFVAQLKQESGLRPGLTSSAGAQGIAQFIPSTAKAYGVNLHDGRVTDDLNGAARYMADNLKQTGGSYEKALSIYNSGRPDAYKDPGFAGGQTYNYVRTIMGAAKVKAPKATPAPAAAASPAPVTAQTPAVPGVDNSGLRRQLVGQFLAQGGVKNSNAVLGLAAQYGQAADVPGSPATYGQPSASTSGSTTPAKKVKNSGLAGVKNPNVMELFWNGQNAQNWDEGDFRPQGYVSGHTDHVHVSAGPNTILALGKEAQGMGLNVGENPAFGGVAPVHADGSFHYRNAKAKGGQTVGEGIDVSGDPAKMAAFAKLVAKLIRAGAGKNKK